MQLHFAETSDNRGQYDLLAAEHATNSLLSYQYGKQPGTLRAFEHYWELLLHLHLSGTGPIKDALIAEEAEKHLMSYAYHEDERAVYGPAWDELTGNEEVDMRVHLSCSDRSEEIGEALSKEQQESHLLSYVHRGAERSLGRSTKDLRPRVIIDSGAFTAWRSGNPIRLEDYGEWALAFRERWQEKMKSLEFINLDVIGDQVATWDNQAKLEQMGLEPVPVVTRGAPMSELRRALDGYDYVCLGGLVPLARDRKEMRSWLDKCFSEVMACYRVSSAGEMPKIHLLGVTQPWVLMRYPAYSTDSSAWVTVLRYGDSPVPGLRKVPRRSEGPAAVAANLHVLRSEIRRFKKMERDATALWASRGVEWED